jgi:GDP-D-mannose dehydratase
MKKALIAGVTGQNDSYLEEFLLSKGYKDQSLTNDVGFYDNFQGFRKFII